MSRKTHGFTLVELLVVITIIGMLVGLLMPAVQSAREAGRRAQCMNNQRQISLALHSYQSERGHFPGYVGEYRATIGNSNVPEQRKISWFVSLLPYVGRMDLHDLWKDLNIVAPNPGDSSVVPNPIPAVTDRIAICPSYSPPSASDAWLSYRANVGRMTPNAFSNSAPAAKTQAQCIPAEGVFTDQFQDNVNNPTNQELIVKVNMDFISSKDGASNTLMISENSASVPPAGAVSWEGKWSPLISGSDTANNTNVTTNPNNATILGFNWYDNDPLNPNSKGPAPNQKIFANHPGGVIASFCDGHQAYLSTDIERVIYMQLMCPSDRDVYAGPSDWGIKDPNPANAGAPVPPLDESKF